MIEFQPHATMDDQLRRIEAKLDALGEKLEQTHTSMFTRGGAFDRIDNLERKTSELGESSAKTRSDLDGLKGKVAFAASCISAIVAVAWAVITKFWNPHN